MENIAAYTGEAHVTSNQFRSIIESLAGTGSYIADLDEQLEPELSANNTLKIRSGVLIHHGHVMRVPPGTYDTVTYINGSQGMKRIDLVVARYEKNSETKTEPTDWAVIRGTPDASNPVAPEYTEGNMQNGDLVDECPVFEVHFDGLNVTEVKKLVAVTKNIDALRKDVDKLNSALSKINKFSGILTLNSQYNCCYYKNGNVVTVTIDFGEKEVNVSGVELGTLPEKFRPSTDVFSRNSYDNQCGKLCVFRNGRVLINSSQYSFDYMVASVSFAAATSFDI